MPLPLTDKFILKIYKTLENVHEKADVFPKSFRESISPDLKMLRKFYEKEKRGRKFSQFLNYLKKRGYIKIENLKGKEGVLLTQRGEEKALGTKLKLIREKYKNLKLKKRKDGKWLMVVFDIPERKRKWRDFLRENLQNLGFIFFQKSIWVSPYEVRRKLERMLRESQLDRYVKIFLIKEIET
jgi:phenylacetic acid degradation operon negative regulatory protein